jgi:outer membrane lipoprotein LolB
MALPLPGGRERPRPPAGPASGSVGGLADLAFLWRLALPLLLLGLAACAPQPTAPPPGASPASPEALWQRHRERLAALHDWRVAGRLALQTEADGYHGTLDWRQHGERYAIRVNAPLGQGAVELAGGPTGVVLSRGPDQRYAARRPEGLLEAHLGWRVPVQGLAYWVRGLPRPARYAERELDAQGRLTRLEQDGWRIELRRYRTVQGVDLPDKVFLTRPGLAVRLVVQRWSLGPG